MSWQLRGRGINFSVAVDPAAFDHVFSGFGEHSDAASAGGRKKLKKVKLDQQAALECFGKVGWLLLLGRGLQAGRFVGQESSSNRASAQASLHKQRPTALFTPCRRAAERGTGWAAWGA